MPQDRHSQDPVIADKESRVSSVELSETLDKLPYDSGASWDPDLGCLLTTRQTYIDTILEWAMAIGDEAHTENIYCLTGAPGTGKSSIAHEVAQCCYENHVLASSFFFDREFEEASNPQKLFSTVARDLAWLRRDVNEAICTALESDPSLPTASIVRQWKPLILDPSHLLPSEKPFVIVIDALDEGYDEQLLHILCDEVPKLPRNCRIFITSRELSFIDVLLECSHVRSRTIDISDQTHLDDIDIYAYNELRNIAEGHSLDRSWPDRQFLDQFTKEAEGSFLWVTSVTRYLRSQPFFTLRQLLNFLPGKSRAGASAEAKMDELYVQVLSACNWEDEEFVEGYRFTMGAILAAKSPLSLCALESLLRTALGGSAVLRCQLGCLLDGWRRPGKPVKILHRSLRNFLTNRSLLSSGHESYYIDEKEHSRRLAFLCLRAINEDLSPNTPGVGYLDKLDFKGISEVAETSLPEHLRYACTFWMDHIIDAEAPIPVNLAEQLANFSSFQLRASLELQVVLGPYKPLSPALAWIKVRMGLKSGGKQNLTFF